MKRCTLFLPFSAAMLLVAHPMGNFSVSHYTRLELSAKGVEVTYALDLGEIPTFQLLRDWKLDAGSAPSVLEQKAAEQAREWIEGLEFRAGGRRLEPEFVRAEIKLSDGAGGLPVARITSTLRLDGVRGPLQFEDHNYADRGGWKEIVIRAGTGAQVLKASHGDLDRSKALTGYPADPVASAPQDLRASMEWQADLPAAAKSVEPRIVPLEQPKPVAPETAAPQSSTPPPETLARGDFLSSLLGKKEVGLGLMLAGLAVAFVLGSAHALTPGHGKTIVAAYLVGSRGTMKHAAFLGATVTFTHTISVFLLGLGTLFLSNYVVPEKIAPVLGVISGLSIVAIGASLFYKRLLRLREAQGHRHSHDHHHSHDHDHAHGPGHDHPHHDHDHHEHGHSHSHTHVPEGDITPGALIALGASGGLVPCPSALVLLLSSIALGHVGLGLVFLVAFSLGLAGVLMSIGMLVLYAKHLLPDPSKTSRHPAFRLVPVLSALVIVCLGLLMTGVSLGWVKPGGLVG